RRKRRFRTQGYPSLLYPFDADPQRYLLRKKKIVSAPPQSSDSSSSRRRYSLRRPILGTACRMNNNWPMTSRPRGYVSRIAYISSITLDVTPRTRQLSFTLKSRKESKWVDYEKYYYRLHDKR